MLNFPTKIYPGSSSSWKGHATVGYGVNDIIDINVTNQGEFSISSRKNLNENDNKEKHFSTLPAIPLTQPNDVGSLQIIESVRDAWICPHEDMPTNIAQNIQTTKHTHLNALLEDTPELLIDNIMSELLKFDMNMLFRRYHPLKFGSDMIGKYGNKKKSVKSYREHFRESEKHFISRFTKAAIKRDNRRHFYELDQTLDAIFEIPRGLLLTFLDEELMNRYDLLTTNSHLGNCLSNCNNLLIHPKGLLNTLCISPITSQYAGDDVIIEYGSTDAQTFDLDSMIKEIDCKIYDDGGAIIGVRSDYTCTFLTNSIRDSTASNNTNHFQFAETVSQPSRILAMAVNPYFNSDAVFCLENGAVNCWSDGLVEKLLTHRKDTRCRCKKIPWVNCLYGQNPRSFMLIHQKDAYMYDVRAGQKASQSILQLPNQHVNKMDLLARPASLHPGNPHQILLTSEQGLIVIDERFANCPLIIMNHYMQGRPLFMKTVNFMEDSTSRTLTFLGGYRYRETRCLEFEQTIRPAPKILQEMSSFEGATHPPSCSRKPWKLSRPDEWLQKIGDDSRISLPSVNKRLKQPLIGLSVFPNRELPIKDLVAVQLTKPGDLYYQYLKTRFKSEGSYYERNNDDSFSNGCDCAANQGLNQEVCFHGKIKERCESWIRDTCRMYDENPKTNEAANISSAWVSTNRGNIEKALNRHSGDRRLQTKVNPPKCVDDSSTSSSRILRSYNLRSGRKPTIYNEEKPEKHNVKQPTREDDVFDKNVTYKTCKICRSLFEKGSEKCNGCELNVELMYRLQNVYQQGSLLTSSTLKLNRDEESPDLNNLVTYHENSLDALSMGLSKNWDNDEFYTPIDLTKYANQENDAEITDSEKEDSGMSDFDEEDGWFLSASGTLEFGRKEAVHKEEKNTNEVMEKKTIIPYEWRTNQTRDGVYSEANRSSKLGKETQIVKDKEGNKKIIVQKEACNIDSKNVDTPHATNHGKATLQGRSVERRHLRNEDTFPSGETHNRVTDIAKEHLFSFSNDFSEPVAVDAPVPSEKDTRESNCVNEENGDGWSLSYNRKRWSPTPTPPRLQPIKDESSPRKKKIPREIGF